jgi:hypothetical protein
VSVNDDILKVLRQLSLDSLLKIQKDEPSVVRAIAGE